jgi:hypothetical protein
VELEAARQFIKSEVIEPWREERIPGRTFGEVVAARAKAHFGPQLRRAGFDPTATEVEAITAEILAEINPQPATAAAALPRVEARPAPSAAEVNAATDFIEQRKRELGLEPSHDKRPAVPVGDLEQDIVARWKSEPAIRSEFRSIEAYAGWRRGIRDGTIGGYDSHGEKLQRTDPVARAILDGDEEDRLAAVDYRLPVEARARQVWRLNPKVRTEFGDVEERYIAARVHAERSRRA